MNLLGKALGFVVNIIVVPLVFIVSLPFAILKVKNNQKNRLLFTGKEQSLFAKAQRVLNMNDNGLLSPDRDLLVIAQCIESARCEYQVIKGREKFEFSFSDFLASKVNTVYVKDMEKVVDFFEFD